MPRGKIRKTAGENVLAVAINAAIEQELLAIGGAVKDDAQFWFKIGRQSCLAWLSDNGGDVVVNVLINPTRKGQDWVDQPWLSHWKPFCDACATGELDMTEIAKKGAYLRGGVLFQGRQDVTRLLEAEEVAPRGFALKPPSPTPRWLQRERENDRLRAQGKPVPPRPWSRGPLPEAPPGWSEKKKRWSRRWRS